LLEYGDGHYELFDRRGTIVALGDKRSLRQYFALSLTPAVERFFLRVRAGQPMDEVIAGIAEPHRRPG
jgi:hypothetical protein